MSKLTNVINAIKGVGAQALGRAFGIMDDTLGRSYKWTTGQALKALKPKGMYVDPDGRVIFRKATPPKVKPVKPTGARYGEDTFRGAVGSLVGKAHNNARFFKRLAGKLDSYGRKQYEGKNTGRNVAKGLKYTAYAGLGTGMASLPYEVGLLDKEDSTLYKTLDFANTLNPYAALMFSEYSPANQAFMYTTPIGLGVTAGVNGAEALAEKGQDIARQSAQATIDSTANALSDLGFAERLAYLFNPSGVANTYREKAIAQLASSLGGTGDETKDKAMRDLARTVTI